MKICQIQIQREFQLSDESRKKIDVKIRNVIYLFIYLFIKMKFLKVKRI